MTGTATGYDARITTLALGVLFEKIMSIPKEDQNDLYDLLNMLRDQTDPEEIASIQRAMDEILRQEPIKKIRLVLAKKSNQ